MHFTVSQIIFEIKNISQEHDPINVTAKHRILKAVKDL